MNILFFAALVCGILFYLIIPGGGAFYVRRRWRIFRNRIVCSTKIPEVSYAKVKNAPEGYLGEFRMLGSLQAIQGNDTIWISNESISLRVHLSGVDVYTLPRSDETEPGTLPMRETFTDDIPVRMPWSRFFSLPEGTRLYVSGELFREKGQLYFRSTQENPLLVLIYDGPEDSILLRTIWAGRQKNEYVNDFTPISLAAGGLVNLLFTYLSIRQGGSDLYSWLIFTMALSPFLVMLPPGLIFFELYRYFWHQGRRSRGERDLVNLTIRYWPQGTEISECRDIMLPGGQFYGYRKVENCERAVKTVTKGKLINTCLSWKKDPMTMTAYVFGVVGNGDGKDEFFPLSRDLLISPLIIPGDPYVLVKVCSRRARIMEILAGLFVLAGFLLNLVLFLLILVYLIN